MAKRRFFLVAVITLALVFLVLVLTSELSGQNNISDNKKGLYVTSFIARSENYNTIAGQLRESISILLETTELNTVVIDVMDLLTGEPLFTPKMKRFITLLKERGVYCIARIVVGQNNYFAELYPETVLKRKSTGKPWS